MTEQEFQDRLKEIATGEYYGVKYLELQRDISLSALKEAKAVLDGGHPELIAEINTQLAKVENQLPSTSCFAYPHLGG